MSAAINTLARTTVLDAVADTAGSPSGLKPAKIDNTAIEAMLRRGRRWRIAAGMADDAPPLQVEQQAPALTWEARFRRSKPPAISFFISLAVHLVLLLAAALVAVQTNQAIKTMLFVEAALADSDQEELVTLGAPLEVATTTALDDAKPAAFTTVALDPGGMHEGAPAIALVNIGEHVARVLPGSIARLAHGAGDGLASEGEGKGSDKERDAAVGNGTEFFGVQGRGNKFVFVCDCSGSMNGLKWFELNRELSRCIGSLVPGQAFYLIFFDGEMHPMFEPFGREPALLDATSDNIDKARQWIANKSLGRNTSPCDSMKFAASLEPDAIFLLTDGEFSDYTAPYMRDFNKKRVAKGKSKVVVHTIGFFSQKHQMVLERIAKDSGGTYQFVAGPKPVKEKRKSQNVIAAPIGLPAMGGPAVPASSD